ncbi:hypothetical protein M9Y10_001875 [Tritrichomonas musculus]|uniref:Uncharacterized protein n=1 Tax=Tritrichomonas musculus TaxID=1915356 RepID=A0ABR2L869_9EUKA
MSQNILNQKESIIDIRTLFQNQSRKSLNPSVSLPENHLKKPANSNNEIELMKFDANNPFYAQIFRYRYDSLTYEREKERDSMLNTRSSNFLVTHYPSYGMFRIAEELAKEKIFFNDFDHFEQKKDSDDLDSLNMIRLNQTIDILNSVLKESEEKSNNIKSQYSQFVNIQRNCKERVSKT